MKKIILSALILSSLLGCKKDEAPRCEKSVAVIAANYKLTKVETVSASGSSDVTATLLSDCQKNALYLLKTDNLLHTQRYRQPVPVPVLAAGMLPVAQLPSAGLVIHSAMRLLKAGTVQR